nr:unnamed protein product [Spirometra erinaceieuropaei]
MTSPLPPRSAARTGGLEVSGTPALTKILKYCEAPYLGLGLFPSRTEFLRRLALDQPDLEDYVMERLSSFVKDYRRKLVPLCNILVEYGLEDARASNSPEEVTSRTEEEEAVVVSFPGFLQLDSSNIRPRPASFDLCFFRCI